MKYSFSEERHVKSVTLCDFKEKYNNVVNTDIKIIPLEPRYQLKTIRGCFEEIKNLESSNDFVRIILTDEEVNPESRSVLYGQFPNLVNMVVDSRKVKKDVNVVNEQSIESLDVIDLFKGFYKLQNNNCEISDEYLEVFKRIVNEMNGWKL